MISILSLIQSDFNSRRCSVKTNNLGFILSHILSQSDLAHFNERSDLRPVRFPKPQLNPHTAMCVFFPRAILSLTFGSSQRTLLDGTKPIVAHMFSLFFI